MRSFRACAPRAGARNSENQQFKDTAMTSLPPCPKCSSEYVYEDAGHLVCPECAHEWTPGEEVAHDEEKLVVKGRQRHAARRRRLRHHRQDPQGEGCLDAAQDRHQGEEHPPRRRRPQHRLQDRRLRRDAAQVRVRQEALTQDVVLRGSIWTRKAPLLSVSTEEGGAFFV